MRSQGRAEHRRRARSDTQDNTTWERERAAVLLLQDREHHLQDVRQARAAWRQQAARAPQTLVVTAGEKHAEPKPQRWGRWGKPERGAHAGRVPHAGRGPTRS